MRKANKTSAKIILDCDIYSPTAFPRPGNFRPRMYPTASKATTMKIFGIT